MKSLVNRIAMLAAGALVLGTMAYGQTEMKAQIPFAFHTSMSSLPAGEYVVTKTTTQSGAPISWLWNTATHKKVFLPNGYSSGKVGGSPALLFQCVEDGGCALAGIRGPEVTYKFSTGRKSAREKEANTVAIALRPVHAD